MKMSELEDSIVQEGGPSQGWKAYCTNTPRDKMSASWESGCVARGHLTRKDDTYVDGEKITGKKAKSTEHGGPVPDHS
jgi:hypothetical protein